MNIQTCVFNALWCPFPGHFQNRLPERSVLVKDFCHRMPFLCIRAQPLQRFPKEQSKLLLNGSIMSDLRFLSRKGLNRCESNWVSTPFLFSSCSFIVPKCHVWECVLCSGIWKSSITLIAQTVIKIHLWRIQGVGIGKWLEEHCYANLFLRGFFQFNLICEILAKLKITIVQSLQAFYFYT